MKLKHILFFLILFVVAAQAGLAQDSKKELENISRTYKEQKSYKCKVSFRLFETFTSHVPAENFESLVLRGPDKYLSSLAGTIQLSDATVFIVVDSSNQTIVVSEKPKGFGAPQQMELDTIIKYFSAELLNTATATSLGRINMKPVASFKEYSEMEKLEIYYDKNYFITKWVMYSALSMDIKNEGKSTTRPRLEVTFGKLSALSTAEQAMLDKKYYYYQKSNVFYPSERYKAFTMIDGRVKVSK